MSEREKERERERERERLDQRHSLISYYTSAIPFTCKKKKKIVKMEEEKM